MINQFLISFCNNKKYIKGNTGYIGLLSIDASTQKSSLKNISLDLPEGLSGNGITGMCMVKDRLVLLLQNTPSILVYLDSKLNYKHHNTLKDISGVHTIISDGSNLYLSVTNQDKIVKINQDLNSNIVWSSDTEKDTIHLNSICLVGDELYATAFGPKSSKLWSSAQSGYIFNTNTNEKLLTNIWHPHSLFNHQNQLFCCDSTNQRVVAQNGNTILGNIPGYARGLFIDDSYIVCGSSLGRQVSHSTGVKISNKSDSGMMGGVCGINVFYKETENNQFINLEHIATEVFEIINLDHSR